MSCPVTVSSSFLARGHGATCMARPCMGQGTKMRAVIQPSLETCPSPHAPPLSCNRPLYLPFSIVRQCLESSVHMYWFNMQHSSGSFPPLLCRQSLEIPLHIRCAAKITYFLCHLTLLRPEITWRVMQQSLETLDSVMQQSLEIFLTMLDFFPNCPIIGGLGEKIIKIACDLLFIQDATVLYLVVLANYVLLKISTIINKY